MDERRTLINFLKWYLSQDMENNIIIPYEIVDIYLETNN